jgi:hypothetical protein
MSPPHDPAATLRRRTYVLLITLAAALATGRVVCAVRVYEPQLSRPDDAGPDDQRGLWPRSRPQPEPTFGSNDRSRWAAVRALVDEGTWVVGRRDRQVVLASGPAALAAAGPLQLAALLDAGYRLRVASDRGIITEDGWQTVDKVLHPARLEYYSTKPPLLTVLAAGEYWLLKKTLGWSLSRRDPPKLVAGGAAPLAAADPLQLAVLLQAGAQLPAGSDRGAVDQRWAVVRVLVWTFNILPLIVYLALLARLAECYGGTDWGRLYMLAAAGFGTLVTPFLITFNNHTVAASSVVVALYAGLRVWSGEGEGGVPEAGRPGGPAPRSLFVLAGFFAGFTACNELPATAFAVGLLVLLGLRAPGRTLLYFVPAAAVPVAVLLLSNYLELGQLRPAYEEFNSPWYTYEGSHWRRTPGTVMRGIDWARDKETRAVYAFHLTLGHHGIFSLTPINFLALAGMALGVWRWGGGLAASPGRARPGPERTWNELAAGTLVLSAVVVGFYIRHESANYGGVTNGPRWLMWLTPLWLLSMLPVADWLGQRRWGRALALGLLALSVLSASYAPWNPWRHPWIYDALEARGLIPY